MHRYHPSDRTTYESIGIPQEQQDEHDNGEDHNYLLDGDSDLKLDAQLKRQHQRQNAGIIPRRFSIRAFVALSAALGVVAALACLDTAYHIGSLVRLSATVAAAAATASPPKHQEMIPTLLSVVHPETNEYLYALDNPLYERLKQSFFSHRFHQDDPKSKSTRIPASREMAQPVELNVDSLHLQVRDSLTLTWTCGRDVHGNPIATDDDVLVLHCMDSNEHEDDHDEDGFILDPTEEEQQQQNHQVIRQQRGLLHPKNILEAATLAQARATSLKHGGTTENTWFIPKFPILRQETCQFLLYQGQKNQNQNRDDDQRQRYYVLAESPVFHLHYFVTSPTAIHLALASDPSMMVVNFVTGGTGTPVAMYGIDDATAKVEGTSTTYTAQDLCQEPANVTESGKFQPPGLLHTVQLTELLPNTTYHYKVGLAHGQGITWSETYRFTSAPVTGDLSPFTYIVYGDQGCPSQGWGYGSLYTAAWTTREVERTENPARAVHHFGDLSYAQGAAHIWDEWFDMIQTFTTRVPLMIGVGNHEYDHTAGGGRDKDPSGVITPHGFSPVWGNFHNDSGGECGVPTNERFTMPQSLSSTNDTTTSALSLSSNGVFWYSYDFASVHTTVISSEHDLSAGSPQHAWLEQDFRSVNRTKTPWLVVEAHRPMYEGEAVWANNAVGIAMRYEMEDLLRDYQVDLFLSGHYHAYHRSCAGLYRSKCHNGGPTHITVGSGGARLDDTQLFRNTWSAKFIKQEYGYGRITVMNATALHFEFVKAGDQNDTTAGDVHDNVWIQRL
jgi:hypothetical protein